MALSSTVIGILYIVLSWRGGDFNIVAGLAGLFLALVVGSYRFIQNRSQFYITILKRLILYSFIGVVFILLPEGKILEFKYRDYPEYLKLLKSAQEDPDNKELWAKVREERQKIEH